MAAQDLRDYQARGIALTFEAWKQGARSVLLVLPTGGGKTTIFGHVVADLAQHGRKSLINVHRRELVTQACNRLTEFGTDYGVIMAGEPERPYAPVQVASVQTLARRIAKGQKIHPAVLIVNDEAHLSVAETWHRILSKYPHALKLGVTATPWRLSGKPLSSEYDAVVVVASPRDLCEAGYLSPYTGFSYKTPDLDDVKTVQGEYDTRQSERAMSSGAIVDNVVEEWLKHSSDLSTVVFAVTVEHSKMLCSKFKAAGVRAEHLDGATPIEQRRLIMRRVASGQTQVLCNVGVAVEGLDIPRLKCCVLARPTQSLARAIQMMGRVRRPWRADGRKVSAEYPSDVARIHDHAFIIRQHGLPDDTRDYRLEAPKEAHTPQLESITTCDQCMALYRGSKCTACAAPKALKERVLNTISDAEKVEFSSVQVKALEKREPVEVKWNSEGRTYEGVLSKRWETQSQYGNGKQRMYLLKGDKRDYHLPGTAVLNARLATVGDGTRIRVTYLGEVPAENGRTRKNIRVEKWDESEQRRSVQRLTIEKRGKAPSWVKGLKVPTWKRTEKDTTCETTVGGVWLEIASEVEENDGPQRGHISDSNKQAIEKFCSDNGYIPNKYSDNSEEKRLGHRWNTYTVASSVVFDPSFIEKIKTCYPSFRTFKVQQAKNQILQFCQQYGYIPSSRSTNPEEKILGRAFQNHTSKRRDRRPSSDPEFAKTILSQYQYARRVRSTERTRRKAKKEDNTEQILAFCKQHGHIPAQGAGQVEERSLAYRLCRSPLGFKKEIQNSFPNSKEFKRERL